MKLISTLKQPNNLALVLFFLAALILLAVIIANYAGLSALALSLASIAEPVSACAVAVLIFLAVSKTANQDTEA